MNKINIFLVPLVISLSLFFFAAIQNQQAKNAIRGIYNEYIPIHSNNELESLLNEQSEYFKKIAMSSFNDLISLENIKLTLTKISEENKDDSDHLKIIKYKADFLTLEKRHPELGPSYIAYNQDKLYIMQENGLFFSANIDDFGNEVISVSLLQSNLNKFTQYFDFYAPGQFGVKDILILNGNLYVSYVRELEHNCFNTSVLKAELSEVLDFSMLYSPEECIKRDKLEKFNAHQSGGRMYAYKDNKILITIGEYKNRLQAQDLSSDFGKIMMIDAFSGEGILISMGHRNSQGLYYSNKYDDIWSTDHGPFGGDELNRHRSPEIGKIENYGWPIASYGAHYGSGSYQKSGSKLVLIEDRKNYRYKKAPLYKSHEKHGFVEPLLHFSPSVGISQVIEIDTKFAQDQSSRALMLGTMGYAVTDFTPSLSLFILSLNPSNQIIERKQIIMNERIRDLIYDPAKDDIYFSGDSNAIIGKISYCDDKSNC